MGFEPMTSSLNGNGWRKATEVSGGRERNQPGLLIRTPSSMMSAGRAKISGS